MLILTLYAAMYSKISTSSSNDPLNRLTAKNSTDFFGSALFSFPEPRFFTGAQTQSLHTLTTKYQS